MVGPKADFISTTNFCTCSYCKGVAWSLVGLFAPIFSLPKEMKHDRHFLST